MIWFSSNRFSFAVLCSCHIYHPISCKSHFAFSSATRGPPNPRSAWLRIFFFAINFTLVITRIIFLSFTLHIYTQYLYYLSLLSIFSSYLVDSFYILDHLCHCFNWQYIFYCIAIDNYYWLEYFCYILRIYIRIEHMIILQ